MPAGKSAANNVQRMDGVRRCSPEHVNTLVEMRRNAVNPLCRPLNLMKDDGDGYHLTAFFRLLPESLRELREYNAGQPYRLRLTSTAWIQDLLDSPDFQVVLNEKAKKLQRITN